MKKYICILAFTTAIALSGCAQAAFSKPGVTQQQYDADLSECLSQARVNTPSPGKASLAIVFRMRDKCMVEKGYTKQ